MFKKIINTFGTKFLGALLNFAIAAVISQAVGDVGKGEQSLLLTTITFILIFSDIVSGSSLVFLTPKHSFSKLILPTYIWSILIGLISACIVPIFYHALSLDFTINIGILSIFASLNAVNVTILIGKQRVKEANYLNLFQPIAILSALAICYFLCGMKNVNAYIIALYVAYGGSWLGGLLLLRKDFRKVILHSWKEYKPVVSDLFKFGILNQTGHFVQFFNLRLSYYLLASYIDPGTTGVFSIAVSLAEAIWIISRSIALVQYARIANSDDPVYSQRLTLDLTKICIAFSTAGMLVLALFPSSFYIWMFGPEFGGVPPLIRILAPGTLMYSVYMIMGHYYSGIGKYQMNTYSALCGLFFTFSLGFTLIPRFEIYGAAITTSCAYIANAAFLIVFFLKHSGLHLRDCLLSVSDIRNFYSMFKLYYKEKFDK